MPLQRIPNVVRCWLIKKLTAGGHTPPAVEGWYTFTGAASTILESG